MWGSMGERIWEWSLELKLEDREKKEGEKTERKMHGSENFHSDLLSFAKIFIRMPCLVKMSYSHGIILWDHHILDLHPTCQPKRRIHTRHIANMCDK